MRLPIRNCLLLLGALATLAGCGLQEGVAQRPDAAGRNPSQAPAISAPTLDGSAFDWNTVSGHPVVLDFWGSWCGPCRAEQADLNRIVALYAARGVVFLGVDVRDQNAQALAYRHDLSVTYPSVVDPDEVISAAYDVVAPPTVIIIDKHGNVVDRFLSTLTGVTGDLDRLL
jgi:thiol-disulfide isomerase/thioredoxin